MPPIPLAHSSFKLDVGGVVGFFGGKEAVAAMKSVHLYAGRRWLGWYNTPGSYDLAKEYGQLATSKLWRGLFAGRKKSPTTLFDLEGKDGPKYISVTSGTILEHTEQFGHLLVNRCNRLPIEYVAEGRAQNEVDVTVVDVSSVGNWQGATFPAPVHRNLSVFAAFIPILASTATCVACAVYGDWYLFATILLGIVCHGTACFVIGSASLRVEHPKPADGSPRGDGLLMQGQKFFVILGEENTVNTVTRGKFKLEFKSTPRYDDVGLCALALTFQFVAQILLVQQGTLFGQTMFLTSLAISWLYNSFLSSSELDELQADAVFRDTPVSSKFGSVKIKSSVKFRLPTRTTAAAFVYYVLRSQSISTPMSPEKSRELLKHIIPNSTDVWEKWRDRVVEDRSDMIGFGEGVESYSLLNALLKDAAQAKDVYWKYENWKDSHQDADWKEM